MGLVRLDSYYNWWYYRSSNSSRYNIIIEIMHIISERIAKRNTYTISNMYIDGVKFCNVLEDTDRGLTQDMPIEDIQKAKVYGKTAIPTGTYKVTLDIVSPKFSKYKQYKFCNGKLPRLLDIPGFDGILIHIGNTEEDTDGCLLVGKNNVVGKVTESTVTFKALYDKMQEAVENGEQITITIK